MKLRLLVTGGSGFIGTSLINHILIHKKYSVLNIDNLTYASNPIANDLFNNFHNYKFIHGNICNQKLIKNVLNEFKPNIIFHLAAESHVDRSIDNPIDFLNTNIMGTFTLLNESLDYWNSLNKKEFFRFHHISTDEVYGDLLINDPPFSEISSYKPSSPYSASKASSDHLVRAWHRTYGLPVVITNCSNNYGFYQNPEKFIPKMIINALLNNNLEIYGDGKQIRDWLFVQDHANALLQVALNASNGETYNIGGNSELSNIEIVNFICDYLSKNFNRLSHSSSLQSLIKFVEDRPGHDRRYAINNEKIKNELNWQPSESFESGMAKTIEWYLSNENWWKPIISTHQLGTRFGKIN